MGDVVDLDTWRNAPLKPNRVCPRCGSQWWNASVNIVGKRVVGWAQRVQCRGCGFEEEL